METYPQGKRAGRLLCIRHLISSRANWLKELLSSVIFRERQMVTKEHTEHRKALHRAVYNDWGLYQFVQMVEYKCVLAHEDAGVHR